MAENRSLVKHGRSAVATNQQLVRSFILAAVVAAVALIAISRGHINDTAYGDGLIYRYVASHLTTPPSEVDPVVSSRGTSVRYGRIGFPALIWATAAGHNSAMPWSQAVLIVLFAGAAGAATSYLFSSAGPIGALLPYLAPGFSLSLVGGYGEVPAVALALWAVIFAQRERWWPVAGFMAAAILVREDTGVVLIGLIAWQLWKRRPQGIPILLTSLIPLLGWYAFAKVRFGHIPLFDPFLQVGTRTPIIAIWNAITQGPAVSITAASIHLVLALVALWLWRRSVLAAIAAAAGIQVMVSGILAWEYVGDAIRVFTFLQLFLLLALLRLRWSEPALDHG